MKTSTSTSELLGGAAVVLGGEWTHDPDQSGPPGAAYLTHPGGHRIGIRAIGPILQTWITAGPLPDLAETGDPKKDAKALTARNARLQPGRSWHITIRINHVTDLDQALLDVLHGQLIPALIKKPQNVLILQPKPEPQPEPASTEPTHAPVPATTPTPRKPATRRAPRKRNTK
ncbi:hypothetical protein [Streptomyces sp. NPDC002845]